MARIIALIGLFVAAVSVHTPPLPVFAGSPSAGPLTLNGAGSTFDAPLFEKAFAAYATSHHVTVNYLSPGLIKTARDPNAPEPQHHAVQKTLTGERGKPEDIAAVVRFLCGPGARYITGQTLHANGGAYLP